MGRIWVAWVMLGFAGLGGMLSLLLLVATFLYAPSNVIALRDWTLWIMFGLFFPTTLLLAFYHLLFSARRRAGVTIIPMSRRLRLSLALLVLGYGVIFIYLTVSTANSTDELVKQVYIIRSWLAMTCFAGASLILVTLRTAFGAGNK
ncbi:MAG TPA: hypothetical protein VF276_05515 [Chloroflexia bacterium]